MTQQLNPMALTVDQAAKILSASGSKPVTAQMVSKDIAAGAPTNPDGTVNLVQYCAWLVKEMGQRAD